MASQERTKTEAMIANLASGYTEWNKDIREYVDKKRNFQGEPPVYKKVTNEWMKEQEIIYNPITQVYKDKAQEKHMRKAESQNMLDTLARNKDRQLCYEQTYNILNFDNKLKGLENRANYPKEKPWYFRPERDSYCDFNILSNIHIKDHHFQAPEKRPIIEKPKEKEFNYLAPARDFNVVTNKYLKQNDVKVATNDEIMRLEAAKRYWNTHNFDPVTVQYYDGEKENKFQNDRDAEALTHGLGYYKKLPITIQNEGLMYNPVNMKIEDENRLLEKDQRDKSKKQRYGTRYEIEDVVRKDCLADLERESHMALIKISHKRTDEQVNRGYDILTNGKMPTALKILKENKQKYGRQPTTSWNKIRATTAANNNDADYGTLNQLPVLKPVASSRAPLQPVELTGTNFGMRLSRHTKRNMPRVNSSSVAIRSGGFQTLGSELTK